MTCTNCGTTNTPDSRFCASCGTRLAAEPATSEQPASSWPGATPPAASAPSGWDPAPPSTPWGPPVGNPSPYAAGPGSTAPPPYGAPPTGLSQQPPYSGGYGPTRTTNGLAVASLVLGIVGGILCGVGSILAIVFGFIARGQIRTSQGRQSGDGMATAGIILGFISIALVVLLFVISAASNNDATYCTYPNC